MAAPLTVDQERDFLIGGVNTTNPAILFAVSAEGTPWAIISSKIEFDSAMARLFPSAVVPGGRGMRVTDQVATLLRTWIQSIVYYPRPSAPQLATLRWRMLSDIHRNDVLAKEILMAIATNKSRISAQHVAYLTYVLETLFTPPDDAGLDNVGEALRLRLEADLKMRENFRKKVSVYKNNCMIELKDVPVEEERVIRNGQPLPRGFRVITDNGLAAQGLKRGGALVILHLREKIDDLDRRLRTNLVREETDDMLRQLDVLLREEQMLIRNWKRAKRIERSIYNDPFLKDVINGTKRTSDEDTTAKRRLFIIQLNNSGQVAPTPEDYDRLKERNKRYRPDAFYTNTSSFDLPDQVAPILPADAFVSDDVRTRFGQIKNV